VKKKIIISIICLVSLIGISGSVYYISLQEKETKTQNVESNFEKDNNIKVDEQINNKTDEEKIEDTPKEEEVLEETKQETNKETKTEKKSSNSSNQSNNTANKNTQTKQQTTTTQKQETVTTQPPTTTKESGPWEAWGMTKDEYYNKPLHSWQRVDFPASSCGSEDSCLNACATKGDTYEGYLYSCDIVTSASGNFLGVMLDLEKVQ